MEKSMADSLRVAINALKKSEDTRNKIFEKACSECSHRKPSEEQIGFEGNRYMECHHPRHEFAGSVYHHCKVEECPHGK